MASATGPADARFETTAAWAASETSTAELQNVVEQNAEQAQRAADEAAKAAQHKVASTGGAIDNLEAGLAQKTDEAVAEGHANTQGYVQQARELAGNAFATAASYMPTSIPGTTTDGTSSTTVSQTSSNVMATLASAAGTALETAKSTYAAASNAAAPHVETARQAAQPHYDTAVAAVQPHYETAKATVQPHVEKLSGVISNATATPTSNATKPDEVPATTAPLESAGGQVGGPYQEAGPTRLGQI
ncbi:hypothetical protein BC835DRAFT_1337531 [Cytidiella melzeri]|nr:hypothetical protein BC835DRAFT_1337531 [Cytidiella melzeri]